MHAEHTYSQYYELCAYYEKLHYKWLFLVMVFIDNLYTILVITLNNLC
jgi:hypothetical protein